MRFECCWNKPLCVCLTSIPSFPLITSATLQKSHRWLASRDKLMLSCWLVYQTAKAADKEHHISPMKPFLAQLTVEKLHIQYGLYFNGYEFGNFWFYKPRWPFKVWKSLSFSMLLHIYYRNPRPKKRNMHLRLNKVFVQTEGKTRIWDKADMYNYIRCKLAYNYTRKHLHKVTCSYLRQLKTKSG